MMAEEEKGFVIRDRRGRGADSETPASAPVEPATARSQDSPTGQEAEQRLPATFLSFVYSLGTSALMLLGENPAQQGSGHAENLSHAQEIIDILSILETKTKGNLTQEEETVLQEMLYALRIKYVEKASASKS
jgi:hypothetical protein